MDGAPLNRVKELLMLVVLDNDALIDMKVRTASPRPACHLSDCTAEYGIKKVYGCRLNRRFIRP